MNLPKLSIVFPNLDGGAEILELLDSIQNSNYPQTKLEVIMIDNGSKDNSVGLVKKSFPQVKIIELWQNYGFSKAVNLGIKKSFGKYIFVTNHDTVLSKNCLAKLIEYLENHPAVGVVGGKIYSKPKLITNSEATYLKNYSKQTPQTALKFNFYTGLFKKLGETNTEAESDWIQGCGMCFTKKVWTRLGGFDEGFFFTYEDLDFCLQAKNLGLKIISYPRAVMWHSEGAIVNRPEFRIRIKYFEGYKGKLRLILKHGNIFQIISSIFLQFFLFAPYRTIILREKSLMPLIQAAIWNLKNLPQTLALRKNFYEP